MLRPLSLALLLFLPACASTPPGAGSRGDAAPEEATLPLGLERAFTTRFQDPDVLVGQVITVEGPADLLAHVALRQEPGVFDYDTKTTRQGLRQRLTKAKDAPPGATIRAQLDNWSLVADQELVVLQRPGDCPVVVRAEGRAVHLSTARGEERREDTLEFRGSHGR